MYTHYTLFVHTLNHIIIDEYGITTERVATCFLNYTLIAIVAVVICHFFYFIVYILSNDRNMNCNIFSRKKIGSLSKVHIAIMRLFDCNNLLIWVPILL